MRHTFMRLSGLAIVAMVLLITSCSAPVTLTGWKNPKENQKVSKVIVWAMFNRFEYQKPFEQSTVKYLNSRGIKAIESYTILTPNRKYELQELEKEFDSIGADGILIFNFTGIDKKEDYVPETTTYYPDYYNSYYGYYSYGYGIYSAPGYNAVTTGGYWTTTNVVNLTANLYTNSDNALLWTGKITVTDPEYVDQSAYNITRYVYSEWVTEKLVESKK